MNAHLTLGQAAQTLGVSERTLRRHIQAGKIQAIKNRAPGRGGGWLLEEETLRALGAPALPGRAQARALVEEQKEQEATPPDAEPEREERALLEKRVEQLEREGALLREQLEGALERMADIEAREDERERAGRGAAPSSPRAWWPLSKSRE